MKKFISIVISIILFFSLFLLELSIIASSMFNENNIKNITKKIDLTKQIENEETSPSKLQYDSALNEVYSTAEEYNVDKETVDEILNSDEVKEFIAYYVSDSANNALNNDTLMKQAEVKEKFDEMVDKYVNNNDKLTSKQKEDVKNLADEYSYKVIDEMSNTNVIGNAIPSDILNIIKTFISNSTKTFLIIISIICIIALILIQFNKNKYLLYIGNTLLTLTIFTFIFAVSVNPITNFLVEEVSSFPKFLISPFSNNIMTSFMISGIITIVISVLCLVIYEILNKRVTSK